MRVVYTASKRVFKKKIYLLLFVFSFTGFLIFSIYLPNIGFLVKTLFSSYNLSSKVKIFFFSLGAFQTNFTFWGRVLVLVLSFLFALNLSLLLFYLKRVVRLKKESSSSFFGALFGVLGVGCTSCGSVILSSILGVSTTAGFLGALPFSGKEFGVLGALFLSYSIYLSSKKILGEDKCGVSF